MEISRKDNVSSNIDHWLRLMRCNGINENGISLEQFDDIKIGCSLPGVTSFTEGYEPFPNSDFQNCVYDGELDQMGRFHGQGSVRFDDGSIISGWWSHGVRSGLVKIITSRKGLQYVEGEYKNDKMDGKVKIKFKDDTWLEGYFSAGVLHGFCRYFNAKNRLTFLGIHSNGKPSGTCWKIIEGGGCIVGSVDKGGKLSGPDIGYIYPDFSTALVGHFDDGLMVSAQHCSVVSTSLESGCVLAPQYSPRKGVLFKREISTNDFVTQSPVLRDPYETNIIKVRTSKVPGASEGLFARSDIPENTVLAFYNGVKLPSDYEEEDSWEANAYKIFDPTNQPDGALDILEEHQSTNKYSASLAHKTNHSFEPNSQFLLYDHPRWGLVPCIASTRDISACEEIFVRYGYDLDDCPDWYREAWNKGSFELIEAKNSYKTLDDIIEQLAFR